MSIPLNPQTFAANVSRQQLQQAQSVQSVLNGNVDFGSVSGNAPVDGSINSGVATQFTRGNGSGVLIRIAGSSTSDSGASYQWTGSNTPIIIKHGLLRQPIGFIVCDQDGAGTVYRTAAPDQNQITLAITSGIVNVTVYVF